MVLANFNIQQCIVTQINDYLSEQPLTFKELKTLLTHKKPITEVQIKVQDLLEQAKRTDIKLLKSKLEEDVYKKQILEDEAESKKDTRQKMKEEQLSARFSKELVHVDTSIQAYYEKQQLPASNIEGVPLTPSQRTLSQPIRGVPLALSQQQQSVKIYFLREKRHVLYNKLHDLELRLEHYSYKKRIRDARKDARISYENTHTQIELTLSAKNNTLLKTNVNGCIHTLEKKKNELLTEANRLYFPLFIEAMQERLPTLQLKPNELTALHTILKLMKQHMHHDATVLLIQEHLKKQKVLISQSLIQLHQLKKQTEQLNKHQHALTPINEQHAKKIKEDNEQLIKASKLKKQLTLTTLFFLGLTCLCAIPAILALSGILFFTSPAIVYGLIYSPSLVFLLTTLGTGIASLVYSFKTQYYEQSIKERKIIVERNLKQLSKEQLGHKGLQLTTIPAIEEKIKKEEELRDELQHALEKAELLFNQTLDQAESISPLPLSLSSLFETSPLPSPKLPSDLVSSPSVPS